MVSVPYRVYNIHLQLIELQFQITPYHITVEILKQSISNFSFLSLILITFPYNDFT